MIMEFIPVWRRKCINIKINNGFVCFKENSTKKCMEILSKKIVKRGVLSITGFYGQIPLVVAKDIFEWNSLMVTCRKKNYIRDSLLVEIKGPFVALD